MVFDADGHPGLLGSGHMGLHLLDKGVDFGFQRFRTLSHPLDAATDENAGSPLASDLHLLLQAERAQVVVGQDSHLDSVLPQQLAKCLVSHLLDLFPLVGMAPGPDVDEAATGALHLGKDLLQLQRSIEARRQDVTESEVLGGSQSSVSGAAPKIPGYQASRHQFQRIAPFHPPSLLLTSVLTAASGLRSFTISNSSIRSPSTVRNSPLAK